MYRCLECGADFDYPLPGALGDDIVESCPSCGSDDIIDVLDEGSDE